MHFDIVFLDVTSPRYYDRITLEKEALGGTEASVVRVAEGLGALGLKVAVILARVKTYFEPVIGQHAFFMHSDDVESMTCKHYIQIRRNTNPQLFKGAKKYIWLHDVAGTDEDTWTKDLIDYNIELIGVSEWHGRNIVDVTKYNKVTYIYNPVPDEIYVNKDVELKYDPNIMVWLSSPHKGLDRAMDLFKEVRSKQPKMQIILFNPGYMKLDVEKYAVIPGVSIYGSLGCKAVWNIVQKSLCVFYPTEYRETFGLIAAESNALGTPILTKPVAALNETVSNTLLNTDQEIVDTAVEWSKNGRPKTVGNGIFKLSNVIMDWVRLLAR